MSFVSTNGICRASAAQASSSTKLSFSPTNPVSSTRCCETGRPVMIDPLTGSTICSCQMKAGIPAYLSRLPTLNDTMYRSGATPGFPPNVVMSNEAASGLFAMGMKADRQTDGLKAMTSPGVAPPFYLEQLMAANPYSAFYPGFDLNGARRKNATRETTSALKAWLYEHRKNPYPTKGEKIMLAIITRMTLTQVSTWFANARRRLKKENKLEDREDSLSDIDIEDKHSDENSRLRDVNHDDSVDLSDISDTEESCSKQEMTSPKIPFTDVTTGSLPFRYRKPDTVTATCTAQRKSTSSTSASCDSEPENTSSVEAARPPAKTTAAAATSKDTKETVSRDFKNGGSDVIRPKIWSISEIISKASDEPPT